MSAPSTAPLLWQRARSRRPALAAQLARLAGTFRAAGWRVHEGPEAPEAGGTPLAVLDDPWAAPRPESAHALAEAGAPSGRWRLPRAPGAPEAQAWDVSRGPFTERDYRRLALRDARRRLSAAVAPPEGAWCGFAVARAGEGDRLLERGWPPRAQDLALVDGVRCFRFQDPADHPRHELDPFLPDGAGLWLEIGCGAGAFAARHRGAGRRWIGVEPDFEMAARAARRLDLVLAADAESALGALPDGLAGAVLADVVEHLDDPLGVLSALARRLAPDGRAVVAFPNVAWAPVLLALAAGRWDPTLAGVQAADHRLPTTPASLAELARAAGFEVERLEPLPSPRLPRSLRWRAVLLAWLAGGRAATIAAPQWVACLAPRKG